MLSILDFFTKAPKRRKDALLSIKLGNTQDANYLVNVLKQANAKDTDDVNKFYNDNLSGYNYTNVNLNGDLYRIP